MAGLARMESVMKDRLGMILGAALAIAAVAAAVVFLWGVGPVLDQAMDTAPSWISLLALAGLLADGGLLYTAVKRVTRHRLQVEPFVEAVRPSIASGDKEEALRICRATGSKGVAGLLAAWLEASDLDDLERRKKVAQAALDSARSLEKDAKIARLLAGLGALVGASIAAGGVVWSHTGALEGVSAMHPFLVTLLGVILLMPSLATMTFIASSVSRTVGEIQAALPAIADMGAGPPGVE